MRYGSFLKNYIAIYITLHQILQTFGQNSFPTQETRADFFSKPYPSLTTDFRRLSEDDPPIETNASDQPLSSEGTDEPESSEQSNNNNATLSSQDGVTPNTSLNSSEETENNTETTVNSTETSTPDNTSSLEQNNTNTTVDPESSNFPEENKNNTETTVNSTETSFPGNTSPLEQNNTTNTTVDPGTSNPPNQTIPKEPSGQTPPPVKNSTNTGSTKGHNSNTTKIPPKDTPIIIKSSSNTNNTVPESSDSNAKFFQIDVDSSTSVTFIMVVAGFAVLVVVGVICYCNKKKKKTKKSKKGDTQRLVRKKSNSPAPLQFQEFAPQVKVLKIPQQVLLSSEPNTNMSPANYFRTAQHLRLEENGRSSLVPDEVILTQLDESPKSITEVSSLPSVRDAPKTLDFNIEFSMVEQESIMKIKKNTDGKKLAY